MQIIQQFRHWRWLIVALVFCAGVALKLNGSSVGRWEEELSGHKASKGLLLFEPRSIRTDEWLVWTPAALAQARHAPRFPVENPNLGPGRATLLLNLPVAYYTTWFRPQLWGFFVLDFERGFSFCWFAKIFGLLLGPTWLLRQLGVRSRGLALFGGAWLFLCVQWWFSSPAMVPEMLATWAICTGCAIQFLKQSSTWRHAIAFGGFVYCGVNFILCSYPPAQIPLAYLMATIVAGFVLEHLRTGEFCATKHGILLVGLAVLTVIIVLAPCYLAMRPTLEIVSHSIYPGARRSNGGAMSIFQLFSGLASFFQTSRETLPAAFTNITLPNHCYPFWPVILAALLVGRRRQQITIPPLFAALVIFIIGLSLYAIAPWPTWLLRSTLLCFSTEFSSTQFALVPANIVLTCVFLDRYRSPVFTRRGALITAAGFCLVIALLFWTASLTKPNFFPDLFQITLSYAVSVALLMIFFWETRRSWLPLAVIASLIFPLGAVNPVMRGLSPLLESETFREVDKIQAADPEAKWIVYNDLTLPELVKATGANVLNGFKIVPDLDLLHRFDPDRKASFVYNRYGHFVFKLPEFPGQIAFRFVAADYYILNLSPGDFELSQLGCRYLALPQNWPDADLHGFSLLKTIPAEHVWIYRQR